MTIEKKFNYRKHSLIEQLNRFNAFIYFLNPDQEKSFRVIRNNEVTSAMIHLTDITDQSSFKMMIETARNYGIRDFQTTGKKGYPGTILCVDATELTDREVSDKFWREILELNRRAENPYQRIYVVFMSDLEQLPETLHQFSTTFN